MQPEVPLHVPFEEPFTEPWQGRAFGLALATVDGLGLEYEDFRRHLIATIAEQPETPYYEAWVAALEALLREHGVALADSSRENPVEIVDVRSSS